jgi:Flp pilus assembly protein TadG
MTRSPVASRTPRASTIPVRLRAGVAGARRGERGAILVHVAVAMSGLLAFSALSIDLGTLWVSRAQAQNAADAAAHAGVVSLAYGSPGDLDAARAAAQAVVAEHSIWGEAVAPASVQMEIGPCPAGSPATPGDCVRVAVERGGASGAPLPTFFARLFGAGATTLRASASAKVMLGNTTTCLRPWAIPDRWIEADGTWEPVDRYEAYVPGTSTPLSGPRDSYSPPGYDVGLAGTELRLYRHDFDHPEIAGENFWMLDLPNAEVDHELRYERNIGNCNPLTVSIGDSLPLTQAHLESTLQGVAELVALDPDAYWDGSTIRGSAFTVSPRLVTIALYDPDALAATGAYNIGTEVVIRNLAGFFVIDFEDNRLHGVIVPAAGVFDGSAEQVTENAAFLRTVALVR